jgi:hypothetical protein
VEIYAQHRDGKPQGESGETDLGWHLMPHPDGKVRVLESLGLLRCGAVHEVWLPRNENSCTAAPYHTPKMSKAFQNMNPGIEAVEQRLARGAGAGDAVPNRSPRIHLEMPHRGGVYKSPCRKLVGRTPPADPTHNPMGSAADRQASMAPG